ncbi:MAG: PIG-L family deacetylase [Planctomycetota bacterium]|nr:PIG-L family deacetylase [Planctomycetota bacterium]
MHNNLRRVFFVGLLATPFFALGSSLPADELPLDSGAAGTLQSLLKLRTTATVLHVVAHPDDEDGGMLTYCARGLGARTTLFSMTRGEGGANLISSHFFDELGILRSLEHLESAKYYGIGLRYSHAVDYGFSKTLEEALGQWNDGTPILEDLVRVVRQEQPDVIVARFRGDARDGHGAHQLSGVLARGVMDVAADPKQFPEQIAGGLQPWQAQKLYSNNIHPKWRAEDQNLWTIALPTGDYSPSIGRSFAQIARYGLGFQRSQGISGHDGPAGEAVSYYRLVRSPLPTDAPPREESFFEGIDTRVVGLARFASERHRPWLTEGLENVSQTVERAWREFDPRQTDSIVPPLTQGLRATRDLMTRIRQSAMEARNREHLLLVLGRKEEQFVEAIQRAMGIDLQVLADSSRAGLEPSPFGFRESSFQSASPGQEVAVRVRVVNRSRIPTTLVKAQLNAPTDWSASPPVEPAVPLEYNVPWVEDFSAKVGEDVEPDRPYWHRDSIREPFYVVDKTNEAGLPFSTRTRLRGAIVLRVHDVDIPLTAITQVSFRNPTLGQVSYPLDVVPRVSVAFDSGDGIVPRGESRYVVRVTVRNHAGEASAGEVRLDLPAGFVSDPPRQAFSINRSGEEVTLPFSLSIPEDAGDDPVALKALVECAGRTYGEGFSTITARDLGRCNLYRPAIKRLRVVDVRIPKGLRVGYVMGSGDAVPAALAELGVETQLLDAADLANGDFEGFDAIVIGVRAYAVRPDLEAANSRLLRYAHDGGTLVVQYQTPEFDRNFGPYPYKMGRNPEEVSEEDAKVTLLVPDHPLMTHPNRITEQDFEGWAEQRGSKFWQSWDERYVPLWECHDRGQPAQTGGMLSAEYGKGLYVYTAYAWYRQLPVGVPGAYRIFANLIGQKPARRAR